VSDDIRNIFDQNKPGHIDLESVGDFTAFVDKGKMEYHVFLTLNTGQAEFVLDMKRWKWFRVDRGTGKTLKCGLNVTDQYGNSYAYGFIDAGYMLRLEYGNTFDGNAIVSTLHTGDFPLDDGNMLVECEAKAFVPVLAAKTTASGITLTHYVDTAASGTDYTIDQAGAGRRLAFR
jgi:nitrite reductase/ring-hydroxylating ferredoxin subunit